MKSYFTVIKAAVCLLYVFCLPAIALSEGTSEASSFSEARERLTSFFDQVRTLQSSVDRSQFDLEALLVKLDYDESNIIGFVSDDIYFEQYAGLLRGPVGTLMSRAGNSLDQSVLLAKLLNDAGFETRIARGTLSEKDTGSLLRQMLINRSARAETMNAAEFSAALEGMAQLAGKTLEDVQSLIPAEEKPVQETEAFNQSSAAADQLLDVLAESNLTSVGSGMDAHIATEASRYFWVQMRAVDNSGWQDLHPAFGSGNAPGQELSVEETMVGSVPENLQHRFRFQVFLGQMKSGQCTAMPLFDAWERPVANLYGAAFSYVNLPSALLGKQTQVDWKTALKTSNLFIPLFNYQTMGSGGTGFTRNGQAVPMDIAATQGAEFFSTVSGKGLAAANALSNLGLSDNKERASVLQIGAVWLEYTFIEPGDKTTTTKRTLARTEGCSSAPFNGITETPEALGPEQLADLAAEQMFMVSAGEVPPAFILAQSLEQIAAAEPAALAQLHSRFGEEAPARASTSPPTPNSDVLLMLTSLMDAGTSGEVNYRHGPSLSVVSRRVIDDSSVALSIDIVKNDRRAFDNQDGKPVFSGTSLVRTGVWETYAESSVFLSNEQGPYDTTPEAFKQLMQAGLAPELMAPGSKQQLSGVSTVAEQQNLASDLQSGYAAVVIPPSRDLGIDNYTWWRVDPLTGQTLGMSSNGKGAGMPTDLTLRTQIGLKASAAVAFYKGTTALLASAPWLVKGPIYAMFIARTIFAIYTIGNWLL